MIDRFEGEHAFLSNFTAVRTGVRPDWWPRTLPPFPTVEHAFQAWKVDGDLVGPTEWLRMVETIRTQATPGRAKRAGRAVPLRPHWGTIRVGVMEHLLREKFSLEAFARPLDATGDHELVEGNHWGDTFWGVCRGEGQNQLGQLLMKLRDELRAEGSIARW
jgi:ribA/ribD-fused uncharacterized protein